MLNRIVRGLTKTRHHKSQIRSLSTNEPHLPLKDVMVVTLEQAVAAPYLTSRLADAGARVVKVEREPKGDFARYYDRFAGNEMSSYFVWLNRGKESVQLDLRRDEDASLLKNLIGEADVFVQNLKPSSAERLGFGSEKLRDEFPRLITVDVSGYGTRSESFKHRKAYDLLVQAESGLCT